MSINITKKINLKKEENLKINNNQIDLDWLEKKNQIIFLNQLFLNENLSSPHLYLKKELLLSNIYIATSEYEKAELILLNLKSVFKKEFWTNFCFFKTNLFFFLNKKSNFFIYLNLEIFFLPTFFNSFRLGFLINFLTLFLNNRIIS